MKRFRRRYGAFCGAAGQFFLIAALLLALIWAVGVCDGLYYHLQIRAEILSEAGLTEGELRTLDGQLAAYLNGDGAALQTSPFNERELSHMADCFDLFVLLRRSLALCALLALALGILSGGTFFRARAALWGAGALLALMGALFVWGIFDFDSLFTAFHRLMFRNDLWLLNPETDVLIRICPQSMFSAMAALIGGGWLGLTGAWIGALFAMNRRKGRQV